MFRACKHTLDQTGALSSSQSPGLLPRDEAVIRGMSHIGFGTCWSKLLTTENRPSGLEASEEWHTPAEFIAVLRDAHPRRRIKLTLKERL
jgi:hypothetical protein